MRCFWWFLVSFIIVCLDQWTKWLALIDLTPYQAYSVIPGFQFFLAFNTGAAWSFLSDTGQWHTVFFLVFSIVASLFLIISIWRNTASQLLLNAAFSLILGGALGNMIDRISRGAVVDFIDVYYKTHHWPIFNIADSAICLGVAFFVCDWWRNNSVY